MFTIDDSVCALMDHEMYARGVKAADSAKLRFIIEDCGQSIALNLEGTKVRNGWYLAEIMHCLNELERRDTMLSRQIDS